MDQALQRALGGEPVTLVLGGEAGVGKSRLIGELVSRARAAGARALVGGCVELDGGGIPLAPLVDMLRALAAELPDDDLDALLWPARARLVGWFPNLRTGAPPRCRTTPTHRGSWSCCSAWSVELVAERPLLLVVEDVQWADRPRSTSSRCSLPPRRQGA